MLAVDWVGVGAPGLIARPASLPTERESIGFHEEEEEDGFGGGVKPGRPTTGSFHWKADEE